MTLEISCVIVLLEGSPGVGKTSLVVALGRFSGNDVVRINLSEQVSKPVLCEYVQILFPLLSILSIMCVSYFLNWFFLLQTDIMDLLGSDLPVESDEGIRFSWSDGILLQVRKPALSSLFFN